MFICLPPALARRSTFRPNRVTSALLLRRRGGIPDFGYSYEIPFSRLTAYSIFHSVPHSRAPTSPITAFTRPRFSHEASWVRQKSCEKRKHVECVRRASVSWDSDGFEGAQPGIKKMGGPLLPHFARSTMEIRNQMSLQ